MYLHQSKGALLLLGPYLPVQRERQLVVAVGIHSARRLNVSTMADGSSKRFVLVVILSLVLELLRSKTLREMLVLMRLEEVVRDDL